MPQSFETSLKQWNAICDRCGFKFKSGQLRKEWNGLRACSGGGTNDCFEVRHPQDFVRGKKDKQNPDWTRPEGEDIAVGTITADDL